MADQRPEELGQAVQCRICGGDTWVAEHDPSCWGNCDRYGCPVQQPCQACHGEGVEYQRDDDGKEVSPDDFPF